jgi:hypothetical protein
MEKSLISLISSTVARALVCWLSSDAPSSCTGISVVRDNTAGCDDKTDGWAAVTCTPRSVLGAKGEVALELGPSGDCFLG